MSIQQIYSPGGAFDAWLPWYNIINSILVYLRRELLSCIPIILNIDVVIGFNQTLYEVSESKGQAHISVTLMNGTLQREAIVIVSITENTAEGMNS